MRALRIFGVLLAFALAWEGYAYAYTDEEIAEFVRAEEIKDGIENYLHKEIYPPRIYRSSTITNNHDFHGKLDQKVQVSLKERTCTVSLAFSKSRIVWEAASKFLMNAVEEILAICRKRGFNPDRITVTLFQNGDQLLGTGEYDSSDRMIRAIPPETKAKKKKKKITALEAAKWRLFS